MSTRTPEPPNPDGIERAYRDATALMHDDRRPAASVRANVHEAAREIAARAVADRAVVGGVGSVGRATPAANRPTWRLRAGGAAFAALLVAVVGWRLSPQSVAPEPVRVASTDVQAQGRSAIADAPVAESLRAVPALPEAVARPSARLAKAAPTMPERPVARASMARRADPDVATADTDARTAIPAVSPPAAPAAVAAAAPAQEPSALRTARASGASPAAAAMAYASLKAARAAPRAALSTPLHAAADRGDLRTLARLVAEPGIAVDAPDAAGCTALLHAVLAQHPDAVRLLLEAGADPDVVDDAGLSARAAGQAGASREIATLLAGAAR